MRKRVNSFDMWDTLVYRERGTPRRVFEAIGQELKIADFVDKRIAAEQTAKSKGTSYSLEDIYTIMGQPDWAKIEFEHELKGIRRIKKYADQLDNQNSIIVSDMYMTEAQLRELLHQAGISFNGEIIVTNYGKHNGTIWPHIQNRGYDIVKHTGDNAASDVLTPRKYSIKTERALTGFYNVEDKYVGMNKDLAYWIRGARLTHDLTPTRSRLYYDFVAYNMPFLWSVAIALHNYVSGNDIKDILFSSRDCQILQRLYQHMYPKDNTRYVWVSRDTFQSATQDFIKYINHYYKKNAVLVDLPASLGALKSFLPHLKHKNPKFFTAIFLESFGVDYTGIDLSYMTTNKQIRINNTPLEMLNYADHWHVKDVIKDNRTWTPVFDLQDEYDMNTVLGYHNIAETMYKDTPIASIYNTSIFTTAINNIEKEGPYIRQLFPKHIQVERRKKREMILNKPKDPLVVISAIHTYTWANIAPWFKSLRSTGFTGDIHMLCYGIDANTISTLKQNGIIVHRCELAGKQVVVDRFKDLATLLDSFTPDTWILFPDAGDIAFQSNPQDFIYGKNYDLVAAHEGVTFAGNRWMLNNLQTSFPRETNRLQNEFFYNAGSVAAKAFLFKHIAEETYRLCNSIAEEGATSHDQTAMNMILHHSQIKNQILLLGPNDPWCFNAASSVMADPIDAKNYRYEYPEIRNGMCVYNKIPYVMFHHYTRNALTKRQVIARIDRSYYHFTRTRR